MKNIKKTIMSIAILGTMILSPVAANAEWKQNADNTWSWQENGFNSYGWKQIDNNWYYFKNGIMQTGWLNIGYTYYLDNSGAMKTGWINDSGKSYYLKSDGSLATNTVVDGTYVDFKGAAQPKENQKVILDNKYVKITYLGVDRASSYMKQVKLQVENKSSQDLIIQTSNVSVDNFMQYGMFSCNIGSGKTAIDGIVFNNSSITTNFNSVEGNFVILTKNYKTLDTDKFSIKF